MPIEVVEPEKRLRLDKDRGAVDSSPELQAIYEEVSAEEASSDFFSMKLLTPKERDMYVKRRKQFLDEFVMNKSSDVGLIHRVIMEEIIGERLYKTMLADPSTDYSQALTMSQKRYSEALEALGASRDKRIKNREQATLSVADLAKSYYDDRKKLALEVKSKQDAEERILLNEQEHRLGLVLTTIEVEEHGITREEPDIDAE
jgi:hypothetical protein